MFVLQKRNMICYLMIDKRQEPPIIIVQDLLLNE